MPSSFTLARFLHPDWLTNTYLVENEEREFILIDCGTGPESFAGKDPALLRAIFLTHHHSDHIDGLSKWLQAKTVPVYSHRLETPALECPLIFLEHLEEVTVAGLTLKALHTPGHTKGHLSFLLNDAAIFTGDLIFKGSVGGTLASNHADFNALQNSIMERVLTLDPSLAIYPGHTDATSVGEELRSNPFVLAWTGKEPILQKPCTFGGKQAKILVLARDYDGDKKAWVRLDGADGSGVGDEVVPAEKLNYR